jgi:hypothetical protein
MKGKNINEQLDRMKSLMTEERLYGNLVEDHEEILLKEEWINIESIIDLENEKLVLESRVFYSDNGSLNYILENKEDIGLVTEQKWLRSLKDKLSKPKYTKFSEIEELKPYKNIELFDNRIDNLGDISAILKSDLKNQTIYNALKNSTNKKNKNYWNSVSNKKYKSFVDKLDEVSKDPVKFVDADGNLKTDMVGPEFKRNLINLPEEIRNPILKELRSKKSWVKVSNFYNKIKNKTGEYWNKVKEKIKGFFKNTSTKISNIGNILFKKPTYSSPKYLLKNVKGGNVKKWMDDLYTKGFDLTTNQSKVTIKESDLDGLINEFGGYVAFKDKDGTKSVVKSLEVMKEDGSKQVFKSEQPSVSIPKTTDKYSNHKNYWKERVKPTYGMGVLTDIARFVLPTTTSILVVPSKVVKYFLNSLQKGLTGNGLPGLKNIVPFDKLGYSKVYSPYLHDTNHRGKNTLLGIKGLTTLVESGLIAGISYVSFVEYSTGQEQSSIWGKLGKFVSTLVIWSGWGAKKAEEAVKEIPITDEFCSTWGVEELGLEGQPLKDYTKHCVETGKRVKLQLSTFKQNMISLSSTLSEFKDWKSMTDEQKDAFCGGAVFNDLISIKSSLKTFEGTLEKEGASESTGINLLCMILGFETPFGSIEGLKDHYLKPPGGDERIDSDKIEEYQIKFKETCDAMKSNRRVMGEQLKPIELPEVEITADIEFQLNYSGVHIGDIV